MSTCELRRYALFAALATALILAAYWPALRAGFIWDDDFWVYRNPAVTGRMGIGRVWTGAPVPGQNYPLTYTFFWLQARFWGLNPVGFHLSNVLLHALNAVLLMLILRKLGLKAAAAAALIWALHPLLTESVAWVTEAKNVLSGFFLLLSLLFYLRRQAEGRRVFYLLSLVLYAVALASKTFIATFPVFLLLLEWYRSGRVSRARFIEIAPFFLLSVLAGAATWYLEVDHVGVKGPEWVLSPAERVLVAGRAFWFYLGKVFFPLRFIFIYPRWRLNPGAPEQWLWPAAAGSALALAWGFRRRLGREALFVLGAYTVLLLPALGFISFYAQIYSFVADHYAYLAAVPPLVLAAALGRKLLPSRARLPSAAGFLLVLLALTRSQSGIYFSQETLYRDIIARNPAADMAHNNLGVLKLDEGKLEDSLDLFRLAISVNPRNPMPHNNRGLALAELGRIEEAIVAHRKALEIRPGTPGFHFNLALALAKAGRDGEAEAEFRQALSILPGPPELRLGLAEFLLPRGREAEALIEVRRALEIEPGHPRAHHVLGQALERQGKLAAAAAAYRRALELDPGLVETRVSLANLMAEGGKPAAAVELYREYVRRDPEQPQVHYNLGVALERASQVAEAESCFRRALELDPDYRAARLNLGALLYRQGRAGEAIAEFEAIVKLDPGYAKGHYNLGLALRAAGKEEAASESLRRARDLDPELPPVP